MIQGRRTLRYESFEEVMPDVERLLAGHTTVGRWTLAQICHHLAAVLRRHVDLPASTVFDPADRVSEATKREVLESGVLPAGITAPPGVLPGAVGCEREEAEGLRAAIRSRSKISFPSNGTISHAAVSCSSTLRGSCPS
jgi:hypothetical protein